MGESISVLQGGPEQGNKWNFIRRILSVFTFVGVVVIIISIAVVVRRDYY
jgi:hypothetical protein